MNKKGPVFIAEIGATNARVDLVQDKYTKHNQVNYLINDFDSIESLIKNYLEKTGVSAKKAIIGVAAPILEDTVEFININLKFSQNSLRKKFFKEQLLLLNDLELQAYAIDSLKDEDVLQIGDQKKELSGSKILVSPGTGLGLSGIVEGKVKPTEAGHLNIPGNLPRISSLVKNFELENKRIPTFEDLLSGKGLNYIYSFLKKNSSNPLTNEEILLELKDPNCLETKKIMLYLLATFLKYMALIWGATGGVYISGSMVNQLMKDIDLKEFRESFEDSETMQVLLENTPVFLVLDPNLGLRGARKLALNT